MLSSSGSRFCSQPASDSWRWLHFSSSKTRTNTSSYSTSSTGRALWLCWNGIFRQQTPPTPLLIATSHLLPLIQGSKNGDHPALLIAQTGKW